MSNLRTKIAAGATVLGLGGLGGYAMATNDGADPATTAITAAQQKPKVRTQVVHRTVHVRPNPKAGVDSAAAAPAEAAPAVAPAPVESTPAVVPAAAPSTPAQSEPVSTHTSGAGSSSSSDDEGENENENEGEGELETEGQDD